MKYLLLDFRDIHFLMYNFERLNHTRSLNIYFQFIFIICIKFNIKFNLK